MARPRNAVVAQSGGPSPAINSSLRGVVEGCLARPDRFGTLYAGTHGIEGILEERLLDLSAQDPGEIALLRTTPAAGAIGTCPTNWRTPGRRIWSASSRSWKHTMWVPFSTSAAMIEI